MSEVTPFALSQLLTNLTGRTLAVAQAKLPGETKVTQIYGEYIVLPWDRALLLAMDLPLLAALGGALLGLPTSVALEGAQEKPMNAAMQDAIHEVLNVVSAVLSREGRVVFKNMVADRLYLDTSCSALLKESNLRNCFKVSMDGTDQGLLTLMTNL